VETNRSFRCLSLDSIGKGVAISIGSAICLKDAIALLHAHIAVSIAIAIAIAELLLLGLLLHLASRHLEGVG